MFLVYDFYCELEIVIKKSLYGKFKGKLHSLHSLNHTLIKTPDQNKSLTNCNVEEIKVHYISM